jgi:hypothetical protein
VTAASRELRYLPEPAAPVVAPSLSAAYARPRATAPERHDGRVLRAWHERGLERLDDLQPDDHLLIVCEYEPKTPRGQIEDCCADE